MSKFKVVGDSKNMFMDIELELAEDAVPTEVGTSYNILGGTFKVAQVGKIIVLTDKDWCLSLMDVTPAKVPDKGKLIINKNIEIYLESKTISVAVECTFEELFYFLKKEWKTLALVADVAFPFEYTNRLKLFTFKDEWNFEDGSFQYVKDGSFSRLNSSGRNI